MYSNMPIDDAKDHTDDLTALIKSNEHPVDSESLTASNEYPKHHIHTEPLDQNTNKSGTIQEICDAMVRDSNHIFHIYGAFFGASIEYIIEETCRALGERNEKTTVEDIEDIVLNIKSGNLKAKNKADAQFIISYIYEHSSEKTNRIKIRLNYTKENNPDLYNILLDLQKHLKTINDEVIKSLKNLDEKNQEQDIENQSLLKQFAKEFMSYNRLNVDDFYYTIKNQPDLTNKLLTLNIEQFTNSLKRMLYYSNVFSASTPSLLMMIIMENLHSFTDSTLTLINMFKIDAINNFTPTIVDQIVNSYKEFVLKLNTYPTHILKYKDFTKYEELNPQQEQLYTLYKDEFIHKYTKLNFENQDQFLNACHKILINLNNFKSLFDRIKPGEYNSSLIKLVCKLPNIEISNLMESLLTSAHNGNIDLEKLLNEKSVNIINSLNTKEFDIFYKCLSKETLNEFKEYFVENINTFHSRNILSKFLKFKMKDGLDNTEDTDHTVLKQNISKLSTYFNKSEILKEFADLIMRVYKSGTYPTLSQPSFVAMYLLHKANRGNTEKSFRLVKSFIENPSVNLIVIMQAFKEISSKSLESVQFLEKYNLTESPLINRCKNINKLNTVHLDIKSNNYQNLFKTLVINNFDIDTQKFQSFIDIVCNKRYIKFFAKKQISKSLDRFYEEINSNYETVSENYNTYVSQWLGENTFIIHEDVVENNKIFAILSAAKLLDKYPDPEKKIPELFDLNVNIKNIKFEVLPDKSLQHFTVGIDTQCCQILGGDGGTAAMDSYLNPSAGVVVLKTEDNQIIAQSYFHYVNNNTGKGFILDNVEINSKLLSKLKINLNEYYSYLAQYAKDKYKIDFFGCGMNYNKLDPNYFEQDSMEDDPRSFTIDKAYSDFNHKQFLNLLKENFVIPENKSKTASLIRTQILKEIYANILEQKYN